MNLRLLRPERNALDQTEPHPEDRQIAVLVRPVSIIYHVFWLLQAEKTTIMKKICLQGLCNAA